MEGEGGMGGPKKRGSLGCLGAGGSWMDKTGMGMGRGVIMTKLT